VEIYACEEGVEIFIGADFETFPEREAKLSAAGCGN
jgi:hypothetical protein